MSLRCFPSQGLRQSSPMKNGGEQVTLSLSKCVPWLLKFMILRKKGRSGVQKIKDHETNHQNNFIYDHIQHSNGLS